MRRWRLIVQVLTLVLCLTLVMSGCRFVQPEIHRVRSSTRVGIVTITRDRLSNVQLPGTANVNFP